MSYGVVGRRTGACLVVMLAVLMGLGGCAGWFSGGSQMTPDEIKAYMLNFLHDRYGQDFDSVGAFNDGSVIPFTHGTGYHMSAHVVGDDRWQAYFEVTWAAGHPESPPKDGYLEVKMQPLFQRIAEDYLSAVFPENVLYAEVRFVGDSSTLPGDISGEDYLALAPTNVYLEITGIMPMPEKMTDHDLTAASVPLRDGLPQLGLTGATLHVSAYSRDDYARYKNQLETQNIDIFQYGSGPLGELGGFRYQWRK